MQTVATEFAEITGSKKETYMTSLAACVWLPKMVGKALQTVIDSTVISLECRK